MGMLVMRAQMRKNENAKSRKKKKKQKRMNNFYTSALMMHIVFICITVLLSIILSSYNTVITEIIPTICKIVKM